MLRLWGSSLGLLVVSGALLGFTPPLGKLATSAGIPALLWSFVISFGAGAVLLATLLIRKRPIAVNAHRVRYFFIAATVSYAIPNYLMFSAIPHLGAGYAGIMFTLSPVMTLVLSIVLGVRRPNVLGMVGLAIGFVGAVLVATTRGQVGQPADAVWVIMGLMIPVFLAVGNIYRTMDWPPDAGPIELAVGSHLAAAMLLLAGLLASGEAGTVPLLAEVPLVVLAQVATAAAMFAFFFRLQAVGGPVYLSQIGYVGAAVGLFIGVLFLGERYSLATWLGAAILTVGVIITTRAQKQAEQPGIGQPAPRR